jgi:hypothetical protein
MHALHQGKRGTRVPQVVKPDARDPGSIERGVKHLA